jgi:hypothetical protein
MASGETSWKKFLVAGSVTFAFELSVGHCLEGACVPLLLHALLTTTVCLFVSRASALSLCRHKPALAPGRYWHCSDARRVVCCTATGIAEAGRIASRSLLCCTFVSNTPQYLKIAKQTAPPGSSYARIIKDIRGNRCALCPMPLFVF